MIIDQGIQTIENYNKVTQSVLFKEIERASDNFIEKTRVGLNNYVEKWTDDPLHQWSRKIEYPFIYQEISKSAERAGASDSLKILDAGSGVTFFPYFIMEKYKNIDIQCLDMDETYIPMFDYCDSVMNQKVNLCISPMQSTDYKDNEFDVIYSVSVIEHTTDQIIPIINEFKRILKPDGLLILTFDISLDGRMDIPLDESLDLLKSLSRFGFVESMHNNQLTGDLINRKDIYNTEIAIDIDPTSLWARKPNSFRYAYRMIREIFTQRRVYKFPPKLTFYCGTFSNSEKNS